MLGMHRRIGRHIRAVMGPDDEHEDIAQEVLITVLRKIGTVRDPACVDAWVAQVTANHLRLVMRQRRLRRQTFCTLSEEPQHPSVQTNVEGREIVSRAMRAMERLPSTGSHPPHGALVHSRHGGNRCRRLRTVPFSRCAAG